MLRFKRREQDQVSGPAEPYWKQRSWQLSAGFLGLVFLVGGISTLTSGHGGGGGSATAKASDGPHISTVTKDGRPAGCSTDDSAGDTVPKAAPKDIRWRTLGVARVPVSASAGPTRFDGELWWCFAHTPDGAVLAANVIPSQMSGSQWRTITEQQVVAGRGREMWEFQRATVQNVDSAADTDAPVASYVGFSVKSYTSKAASVRLLIKGSQGFAATTIDLRWNGGDWKVLPDGGGALHSSVSSVTNTNGFVLWGA
ncbi:hypothetical protein ACIRPX_13630 [Streptomyces sp. NPDC101225]|uniref:hypothetical protein n=1 Tax=Streptomyces sp. NPDC101225 TaxID=3366135 RepID=UPI0038096819